MLSRPSGTLTGRHTRYVHLHVTLFTTTRSSPAPSFFGLSDNETIPVEVLTSGYTARTPGTDASFTPPRFQSLTWRGETKPGSGEWVVKIFSLAAVDDATIRAIIGDEEPGWVLRKEWDAYPELRPHPAYAPVEPVKGVQYLAALEPWVSTMETQTLSAREAVARVVKGWWGLGYGDCANGTDAWDWSCE
jgi:prenylcysteine oxidase/farnesylcysteine lyase